MWTSTSGRARPTAAVTASASRTLASVDATSSPTRASSYSDGSVGAGVLSPETSAPSDASHRLSHEPLKPVWPVTRTRLPRQNEGSTMRRPTVARRG